jgi:ATP-binding cassette subfamily F protein 3
VRASYISDPVFTDLSWEIHDDRVVGLVGPNGCGKSTLLKLIAGEMDQDEGFLVRQKGLKIGYLHQQPLLDEGKTVLQETLSGSIELAHVETELARVELRLGDQGVYSDDEKLARVLAQQERLIEEYTALGGATYKSRVRSTLLELGFVEADLALPIEALSGGQKKLVGLAKLIVNQPDLLLLDEPDNHLDMIGKNYLEAFIRGYKGGVVLVSHDRYMLDMVVDEIVELEDGRLTQYPGNYSEYAFEKRIRLARQFQLYQVQQKEIKRLEQSAKRLLTWGSMYDNNKFIRRGKNILKRIERIDKIDRPVLERKKMALELSGWRGSDKVLEIADLDKVFPYGDADENIVLAGLNLLIWHGERVGLVGPNGSGKSVLFRLILEQELPSSGEIKVGPSVKIGYYAQEHESLEKEYSLIDSVRYTKPQSEGEAVAFLGKFLFNYEQARGPVKNLSGGEKSRLQMALLMLSDVNFLLLDEPTNNLDIASAEVLEEVIGDFEGTVLVISHDRYFLDRVVNRIVELDEGMLNEYIGNYSDYQIGLTKTGQKM